jgi:hypothetical protein
LTFKGVFQVAKVNVAHIILTVAPHTASCTGSALEPVLAPSADLVLAASAGAYTVLLIAPVLGRLCWASAGCQCWARKEYQHCFYAGLAVLIYRRLPALAPAPKC